MVPCAYLLEILLYYCQPLELCSKYGAAFYCLYNNINIYLSCITNIKNVKYIYFYGDDDNSKYYVSAIGHSCVNVLIRKTLL